MVNIAFSFASLLGLLDVLLALFYLFISIAIPVNRSRMIGTLGIVLYVLQAIFAPAFLAIAGAILFFQGWRLDPVVQFAYFLLNALVILLAVKDILIYRSR